MVFMTLPRHEMNLPAFSNTPHRPASLLHRYGIGLVCLAVAGALTALFFEVFRDAPFMLFFPAIVVSTWYSGFRVGLIVSLASSILVNYFFQTPFFEFALDTASMVQIGVFIGVTTLISWFYESRRQIGETLHRQQEWLRVTLTSIGDAVIATDKQGLITFINPVACRLTGWTASEALGRDIHEVFRIINEETRKPVQIPIMQSLSKGVIVGLANHTLLITKQGTELPIGDSGAPIRDASDNVIGAILVFRDMTDRRNTELALQESEARYRDLVERANDVIYTLDLEGNFTSINQAGEKLTGYSREELLKSSSGKLIAPNYLPLMREMLSRKLDHNEQTTYEMEIIDKSGRRLILEVSSRLIHNNGNPTGIYGIARDVTGRRRSETRLAQLQKITSFLSSAATLKQVAQVIVDEALPFMNAQSGVIGLLNEDGDAVELIDTYNLESETAKKFRVLPLNEGFVLTDAVRTRQPVWVENREVFEERYPTSYQAAAKQGSHAVSAFPLIVDGELLGGLSIAFKEPQWFDPIDRDFLLAIAQQAAQAVARALLARKAEETAAFEERQRLARELHDAVSQTLFSATTIAQALPQLWERSPQRAFEQLHQMVVLNRAAMAEMRTLLLELRPEAILRSALASLLAQLVDALQGRRRVEVELRVEGEEIVLPPDVHVAFYRIAQESLNNAAKHSQATKVTVRLERSPEQVVLSVIDNGRGFDMSRTTPGFGLGTMRERSEAIRASLRFTSQPGQGTQLVLTWQRPN
jgi:PAS domain S-box-containing protein